MRALPKSPSPSGFLVDDQARAAIILWASGQFDTCDIARVLNVREDAVYRTLHMAKDAARGDARRRQAEAAK